MTLEAIGGNGLWTVPERWNTHRTRVPPLVGRRQERAAHTAHKASSGERRRRTKEALLQ